MDQHQVGHSDEKAVVDHTQKGVDAALEIGGIFDALELRVENLVSVVGYERAPVPVHPEAHVSAEGLDLPAGDRRGEGHHLDRDRHPRSEASDDLFLTGENHELIRDRSHHALAQERSPVSFDQVERRVDLVGAVDVDIDDFYLVESDERNSQLVREPFGAFRRRNPAGAQTLLDPASESAHEHRRGPAGSEPHHHFRLDHFRGFDRRRPEGVVCAAHEKNPSILDGRERGKIVRIPAMPALSLLPSPKTLVRGQGAFRLKGDIPIVLPEGAGESDFFSAKALQTALRDRAGFAAPIETHRRREDLGPRIELLRRGSDSDSYRLAVSRNLVRAEGEGEAGLRYAVETLSQLLPGLPACEIEDAPDLANRGLLLDISRGKVPTLETLQGLVDLMVGLKLNLLMLYTEHVFRFRRHPLIGKGASPMCASELRELDEYARRRHVELVPTLQSLGHMHQILKHPRYRKLAESEKGWSVSPALEETYALLDDLYVEYVGNFSSPWLNANCDEPVDLGKGLSKGLAEKGGVAAVFASHVARVQDLAAKHGKRTMIWADFIFEHREVLPLLPKGLLLIDWWYEANHDFDRVGLLRENGIPFMAAAGTSGWNTLFPRVENALANIRGYAEAAKRHDAEGLLITEWGDGGHGNLLGNAIFGFAFGAQAAWGPADIEPDAFDRAFSNHLFADPSAAVGRLYRRLGTLHATGFDHFNNSPLKTLYFDDLREAKHTAKAKRSVLERTLRHLRRVSADFDREQDKWGTRAIEREELRYAIEASILGAEKGLAGIEYLRWRGSGGKPRKALASELARIEKDQKRLKRELRRLWLARSRPDGFEKMDLQYEASIHGLRRAADELRRSR